MTEDEQSALCDLRGEVELLRELVAVLLAQLPPGKARLDAMQTAFRRARVVHPEDSREYLAVACAWHRQIERMRFDPPKE